MSIVLLDLKKAAPLSPIDVERFSAPQAVKAFAHGVARAQAFLNIPDLPDDVKDAILHIPEDYSVGRCGLRPITSTWSKLHYPEANYELVFTLAANDGRDVHTLLMYFP